MISSKDSVGSEAVERGVAQFQRRLLGFGFSAWRLWPGAAVICGLF
jgi:hypothetical protein